MKALLIGLATLATVIVAGVVATVAVSGDRERRTIVIPDGIPPGSGAALPPIDVNAPGRSADQLHEWATQHAGELRVPVPALEAYGYAVAVMAQSRPECGIGWTTLAGIGSVESKHGTHGGSNVGPDGQVSPPIRGIPLDGSPGVAEIRDTEGGAQDGDADFDRAMGPLQFIPETWQRWGVDANGDGRADPDNIDDAALTAARYLCERGGDLTTAEGWQRALMAYNQSREYLIDVRDRAAAYSVGVG